MAIGIDNRLPLNILSREANFAEMEASSSVRQYGICRMTQ